jgi:integrase
LRLGELLGLQWHDIQFDRHELLVRRQWTRYSEYTEPKTPQAVRRIPLSGDVVAMLAAHRLAVDESQPEDPVFASRTGTPLSHRNVQRRGFTPAAKAAGLDDVTFHDLRHAFASRMIARGLPSTVLCRIMGHTNPGITERVYVHLFDKIRTDDAVRAAMAR